MNDVIIEMDVDSEVQLFVLGGFAIMHGAAVWRNIRVDDDAL